MQHWTTRRALLATGAALLFATSLAGAARAADAVTLSFLVDNQPSTIAWADQLKKDFEAANPGITITVEQRPGGADGDNIIKTRLATSDMDDVFLYNAGSLFQQINPQQNLVDLTNEPWQANVLASFKQVVTAPDGTVRGAPIGAAMGGGILYNIPIYKQLGLSIPKTWAEFMANNEKIKAAGKVPVIQTFGTTWTSQLFILGDFYNVNAVDPSFAASYTAGKAKYATTPAAMKGFEHGAEVFKAGYLNPDFAAATFEDGVKDVATGVGAHYPMLTFAVSTVQQLAPEHLNDVGFFAIPGDDASKNGLTVWMPGGLYIPKSNTQHLDAAKKFVAFVASTAGCDSLNKAGGGTGPYMIKGCKLPADVPPAVSDLQQYFDKPDTATPALEYLSPVKGPSLEQITVQVGSGISTPAEGAALYDEDVKKQAQQLGLPGW
ncbi:MAG: extracellular solute-binding protein [Devosia sp.]|nr:extracellular solute-binding protein [Devosia sp.]